ncbi:ALK tyrosine kinase receptor [Lates japonicus]
MAMFLHPKQSGQYTIWLIERDKPPLALFSTDTLPRITGQRLPSTHTISAVRSLAQPNSLHFYSNGRTLIS